MFKNYANLTKFGIVIFVVLSGLAGYAISYQIETPFEIKNLLMFIAGIYLLSSGSLALNQVQEYKLDQKMPRTAKRPVAAGRITPTAAGVLAVSFIYAGSDLLFRLSPTAAGLGVLTVLLYNVVYTYYLKPKWIYAAVPGAIPGALPVSIGYAINNSNIWNSESIYLFLILFLWQMPHYWALAIRYKDDYAEGGIPTLPVALGLDRTLYQMGMYTLVYVGVALASPFFIVTSWFYILLVIPTSALILREFMRYYRSRAEKGWLKFFMWINISVLIYLFVPLADKWNFLFTKTN